MEKDVVVIDEEEEEEGGSFKRDAVVDLSQDPRFAPLSDVGTETYLISKEKEYSQTSSPLFRVLHKEEEMLEEIIITSKFKTVRTNQINEDTPKNNNKTTTRRKDEDDDDFVLSSNKKKKRKTTINNTSSEVGKFFELVVNPYSNVSYLLPTTVTKPHSENDWKRLIQSNPLVSRVTINNTGPDNAKEKKSLEKSNNNSGNAVALNEEKRKTKEVEERKKKKETVQEFQLGAVNKIRAFASFNQPLVDHLVLLQSKPQVIKKGDFFRHAIEKAITGIVNCKEEIRSVKALSDLKGVGPWMVSNLQATLHSMLGFVSSQDVEEEGFVSPINERKTVDETMKSRKRPAKKPIEEEEEEEEKELVVNDARKTKSFEKIKKEDFELMLIVDSGERGGKDNNYFFNQLRNHGVKCEMRRLVLGDYCFIVKGKEEEWMHDVLIERKSMSDLAISIQDGRYHEQKYRLNACGLNLVVYLVEGSLASVVGSSVGKGSETTHLCLTSLAIKTNLCLGPLAIKTAIAETRANRKILLKETGGKDETVNYLVNMYNFLADFETIPPVRRMLFSEFNDVNNRVVRPKNVLETFQAMLIQIPGCGSEKAIAITMHYPTPAHLCEAYFGLENKLKDATKEKKRREELLKNITYPSGNKERKIGIEVSTRVCKVFCLQTYLERADE